MLVVHRPPVVVASCFSNQAGVLAGAVLAALFDGVAELPRSVPDTSFSLPTGNEHNPNSSAELTTLLSGGTLDGKTLARNDIITLDAGTTYTGPFTLPTSLSGSGWVYWRSSAHASLPSAGTRISKTDVTNMPIISGSSPEADPAQAIVVPSGASYHRFFGVKFTVNSGHYSFEICACRNGSSNIIFDRCIVAGDPTKGSKVGILLNCNNSAVIDSYIYDIKDASAVLGRQDTQAILAWHNDGVVLVENNYIAATGENVILGAVPLGGVTAGHVPSDFTFRLNHFHKPSSWNDSATLTIKNLFEIKNGRRVLLEKNVLERTWGTDQTGVCVLLTPRNEEGEGGWETCQDFVMRWNKIIECDSGIQIASADNVYSSDNVYRTVVRQNLIVIDVAMGGSYHSPVVCLAYIGPPEDGIDIKHNTLIAEGSNGKGMYITYGYGTPEPAELVTIQDNILVRGDYGVYGEALAEGDATLEAYTQSGSLMSYCAVVGGNSANYDGARVGGGMIFPASIAAMDFENYAGGDYRLKVTSPGYHAASDGTDIGCDIATLNTYLTAVVDEFES